jgi:hypothetical protein
MDGKSTLTFNNNYSYLTSDFALEVLVKVSNGSFITVGDASRTSRQQYLFHGWHRNNPTKVGVNVSVGYNGINVIEDGIGFDRVAVAYENIISGWNQIIVQYKNNIAHLYVNGKLVGKSQSPPPSNTRIVAPHSIGIGQGEKSFKGHLYLARIWQEGIEANIIYQNRNNFSPTLAVSPNVGFWLFDKQPVNRQFEDLSQFKRIAWLNNGRHVEQSNTPPTAPNTPIITWWLNNAQVGTGDSYTMPYSKFAEGVHEYKARVQNLDGTYCESDATITLTPANFGSLSGCYFIRTQEKGGRTLRPLYNNGQKMYDITTRDNPEYFDTQIFKFEHLGNEVYRINSGFYTDMALEHTNQNRAIELLPKRYDKPAQEWEAIARPGQLTYAFQNQEDSNRWITYYMDVNDVAAHNFGANPDINLTSFKLTPTACPLPPSDCITTKNMTYERWISPPLQNLSFGDFLGLDPKQYIQDNENSPNKTVLETNGKFEVSLSKLQADQLYPTNLQDKNWISRQSGYYCAPENGDFFFYVRSNDWAELYISTDEDPTNKRLISASYGHSNSFAARPEQGSYPVTMAKGRSYYFEVITKSAFGGMFTQVAMKPPGYAWLPTHQLQSMSLDNFSNAPRDMPQGFLTVTPNKTKVNPTENVTLTADGCYFGKIAWKAGSEVIQDNANSILSITRPGPGYYQAICTGDPAVTQDWITVVIEPTTGLTPTLNALPPTICSGNTNSTTTITASGAPNGFTYRLYKFKADGTGRGLYNELNSYKNVFANGVYQSIFEIVNVTATANTPAQFIITNPETYWVRIISPAGWEYDVTPLTISPSIPINLNAVNNGPIAPGNQLILSIGSISNASYAWTDKDGNSVGASRMVLRPDFTPNMAGKYSVTVTTAGCNSTKTTDVESLECKVFIASTNLDTGEETYKLARLPNQTDTFAPLKLSLSNYDGTTDFSAYRIEWYHDGNLMPGKIQPTLTTALIGEYTARTTLKVNPDTFCETTVTLSGTPCKDIPEAAPEDCDATYSVPAPDALASGITLSAGDEFTAGDFLVTVTQITSGDKAGWNGEGYVTIKVGGLVELKRLAVTFDAAVVNSCYELSAGGVKTTYDPSWSNILDVDAVIEDALQIYVDASNSLADLFSVFSGTCSDVTKIEEEVEKLEKAVLLDPTQNARNNEIAILELKNSLVSLKLCAGCSTSPISQGKQLRINNVQDCDAIFITCEEKKDVFDQLTVLNTDYKQNYYCELVQKSSVRPCEKDNDVNCHLGGEVRIALNFWETDKYTICRHHLKDYQWIVWRGEGSSWNKLNYDADETSFNSSARNNVAKRLHETYPSISSRNAWYKWADNIARPRNNYWFAAAVDVTSWRGVGAADLTVNAWYVYDEDEFIMRGINKRLLKQNFANFGAYLITPGAKIKDTFGQDVNLTGPALEAKMVEIEQQEVENYLIQVKRDFEQEFKTQKSFCFNGLANLTPWECSIYSINRVSDGTCTTCYADYGISFLYGSWKGDAFSSAMDDFKEGFEHNGRRKGPDEVYDFLNINHRIYIGQRMVAYLRRGYE